VLETSAGLSLVGLADNGIRIEDAYRVHAGLRDDYRFLREGRPDLLELHTVLDARVVGWREAHFVA
jgi:hypothetical protein